ncbi:MAG: lactate racemase domain-containing protein [Aureliella sp.]
MNQPSHAQTSSSEMQISLHFGMQSDWKIQGQPGISSYLDSPWPAVTDISSTVANALENPIDFPSMDQATVSGDTVAFVLDPQLPEIASLSSEIIDWFVQHGTSPANIRCVEAGQTPTTSQVIQSSIQSKIGAEFDYEVHDPDDSDKLAYLAANTSADPIYLNRTIVDADVVIPICSTRRTSAIDFFGCNSLYPLLCERETRGRFFTLDTLQDADRKRELLEWAEEAIRWAGFMVQIQAVGTGQGGRLGQLSAGLLESLSGLVARADQKWTTQLAETDAAVALVPGIDPSWIEFAQALSVADQCTTDHGTIVLCTELGGSIGKSLRRLKDSQTDLASMRKRIAKDTSDESVAAALISRVTQDKHIYLVSNLRVDSVESLGMGVLQSEEQLDHLLSQFPSTNILGSAQFRDVSLLVDD